MEFSNITSMKIRHLSAGMVVAAMLLTTSCSTPKNIAYMQNAIYGQEKSTVNLNEIRVQPFDQISIVVSCKEPELAQLFNLVQTTKRMGQNNSASSSSSNGNVSVYTINKGGDINFPVLGNIHVAGLTREEISDKIARALIDGKWVSDPIVTVEFDNLHFSVIGQVASPGTYGITNDRVTLLEALSMAGDLTIHGNREITVIREENGMRTKYLVDLRDDNLFDSPVFYLKQNDVIYVEPDKAIARQASDNPNNWKSIGLWISIASFLSTMAVLIFK